MSATLGLVPVAATIARDPAAPASELPKLGVRSVAGREWDEIVSGFDNICQEQLFAFATMRWPGVVQEPRLFEHNGRIVGGALVMVQKLPLGLSRIAICKWAPMLADAYAADARLIYRAMVEALIGEYAEKRGMMLSILPHASPHPRNPEYVALRERGFRRGFPLLYPHRYMVKLRLDDAEQRKSFSQTWRRQLNKSEKSGLSFEHAGRDRLGEFKALYDVMASRKQFADHSAYDTLDAMMALDDPLRPELFFVRRDEEIIAGALIFKAGDRAVYLYGATNDQALPLRAGYFLHWHVIRWLRDNTRANWYDLGGTDGFFGLHQFKTGMVGEAGVVHPVPPVANYASRPWAFWMGTAAFVAREMMARTRRRLELLRPSSARPDQPLPVVEDYLR